LNVASNVLLIFVSSVFYFAQRYAFLVQTYILLSQMICHFGKNVKRH